MHVRAAPLVVVPFLITLAAVAAGCDVLAPAPEPEPPPPGWYLSTPVAGIRSLNDIIVFAPADPLVLSYVGYAVGTDGTILKLTRDAEENVTTWSVEDSGTTSDLLSIDGFIDGPGAATPGAEHLLVVGFDGTVLERDGDAWRTVASETTNVLYDVTFRTQTDAFIVGDSGTILRWSGLTVPGVVKLQTAQTAQLVIGGDGSQNLFPIPEPLKGVGNIGPMIAVGARGAVYRYDADGEPDGTSNRWTREDSGTQRTLASINTENGVWAPTVDGVIMRRNGDNDWDDESFFTPAPVFLQDVWVDGNLGQNDFIAVGLSEDIYHFDGAAWTLTRQSEAAEMRGVDGVVLLPPETSDRLPSKEIYVVGGGGRIARGPSVLPVEGEALLESRKSDDDFVE